MRSLFLTMLFLSIGCGGSGHTNPQYPLIGLSLGPYLKGDDPTQGTVLTPEKLRPLVEQTASLVKDWIRVFGTGGGLDEAPAMIHEFGKKAAVNAWLSTDLAANELEIERLIALVLAGEVDLAIVGSETLERGDLTESELIAYIDRVKTALAGTGIPVTTAETVNQLFLHPAVVDVCDVVLVNYYPYWSGIAIESAMAAIHGWHQRIVFEADGKTVIIGETGWPSDGETNGAAIASPENAKRFLVEFTSWARKYDVDYFYFSAYDEAWKENLEGVRGKHWGVMDEDGNPKEGLASLLDGERSGDTWSATSIPGGPGNPTIELSFVPAIGSKSALHGYVWHVKPGDYRVAVYIKAGGWYNKPTWDDPTTNIGSDGQWKCDITTGAGDELATGIAAFLITANFDPPLSYGFPEPPIFADDEDTTAVEVTRTE